MCVCHYVSFSLYIYICIYIYIYNASRPRTPDIAARLDLCRVRVEVDVSDRSEHAEHFAVRVDGVHEVSASFCQSGSCVLPEERTGWVHTCGDTSVN